MKSGVTKRYRPVVPVLSSQPKYSGYTWREYLETILSLGGQSVDGGIDLCCSSFAVPAYCFPQAPFTNYIKVLKDGIKVEIATHETYPSFSNTCKTYWIATIIKVAGYRLLLRYEGMDEPSDLLHDFWVNIGSEDIKSVGNCTEDCDNRALLPPREIRPRQSNWPEYLRGKIDGHRTVPQGWTEIQKREISCCKFKKSDHVELINSSLSAQVRIAKITKIIGRRILVQVCETFLDESELKKCSDDTQITEGLWMDQDSPLIFYVGWASKIGYCLSSSQSYRAHAHAIASAWKMNAVEIPYDKHDAVHSLFECFKKVDSHNPTVVWKVGMKLEVLDPLDTWKELRVATILDIFEDGFLKVGFDGNDMEEEPVPLHCSSTLLFPVGYAEKYSLKLKEPNGEEKFCWNSYLLQTNSCAAPEELFDQFDDGVLKNFKIGAKLEAVDMCEPQLICRATVVAHHGRLLRIRYDGWDESFDQLFDYRSPNILPIGWGEMHGYNIESPKSN